MKAYKEQKKMLDGNHAATEAIKLARVGVISAYPITPQSPIAEKLSEMVLTQQLNAKYIRVESEHTAMSCAIGAQLTGVRAATATSSVGLALMHEILGVASGCRVPIVMPVVNRALVSPWSLWCDHQDAMAERDSGWLQLYVENVQETLDFLLIAYKIAEHQRVLLPTMVCLDGFFLSHSTQPVLVPDPEVVDGFLPPYRAKNLYLDPRNPMFINNLTSPDEFSEMRFQQKVAFEEALALLPEIMEDFAATFGRKYQLLESYQCDDAEVVLVTLGSMAGTAKHVVNTLRGRGLKVGVIKISSFRPFPAQLLARHLQAKKVIGVIDRSAGLGAQGGPLWLEVTAALHPSSNSHISPFVAGLGGRDISEKTITLIFTQLLAQLEEKNRQLPPPVCWIDTRENALETRELME